MTNNSDKVNKELEQKIKKLESQVRELSQRVNYLERENSRRKSELAQVSTALSRR